MTDNGHIPLVQCQSNADLASSIRRGHSYNVIYARIFMKADCFRSEHRPCYHLPPGGSCWSHSPYVWPFVPLPSLCMQLDFCRPVTMFAATQCVNELHETFRTGCQRICWWRGKCGWYWAVPFCHGGRKAVSTERVYTTLASCKELLWQKHSGHPIPTERVQRSDNS
jgi:hypothetical protein